MLFLKTKIRHIVLIRFSAMGDVVLVNPVIQSFLQHYPGVKITLLTHAFYRPFFKHIPDLQLPEVDLKGKHKGVTGLYRLVREIDKDKDIDCVLDLHDVIRSHILSVFFKLRNIPVFRIDKGRKEKKDFVKRHIRKKLPHTSERYRQVFSQAGFDFSLEKQYLEISAKPDSFFPDNALRIGIAPFAAHKSKAWGLEKTQALMRLLQTKYNVHFYLFGGGKHEVNLLKKTAATCKNTTNVAGVYSLQDEMEILKAMRLLIAMDSGNAHIASLLGVPVLSIWGGTHPDMGFSPLYQPEHLRVQVAVRELPCRPCSVYGTHKCKRTREPFACMKRIQPEQVVRVIAETNILS